MSAPVFTERGCYFPALDTLAIADLHIGRGATSAVTMPVGERGALLERLEGLLDRFTPGTVVLCGDVLHAFETVPRGVETTLTKICTRISDSGATLLATRGNHDGLLEGVDFSGTIEPSVEIDGTVFCHGHHEPTIEGTRYVIGHQHPVIEIEGQRRPCSLLEDSPDGQESLIVLPPFTPLVPGTPVNTLTEANLISPLLDDLEECRPVVATRPGTADGVRGPGESERTSGGSGSTRANVHRFPPLRELREYL